MFNNFLRKKSLTNYVSINSFDLCSEIYSADMGLDQQMYDILKSV